MSKLKFSFVAKVATSIAIIVSLSHCAVFDRLSNDPQELSVQEAPESESEAQSGDEMKKPNPTPAEVEKTAKPGPDITEESAKDITKDSSREHAKESVNEPITKELSSIKNQQIEANTKPVKATTRSSKNQGGLSGVVTIFDKQGAKVSPAGTMIQLQKLDSAPSTSKYTSLKSHVIDTRNKVYLPGFLTAKVGDTLVFNNLDPIKHNVFSSSKNNTFDLGTYGFNRTESYKIKDEGVIKIYCNIHPEMALFVSASKAGQSALVKDDGRFRLNDLQPGSYLLKAWNLRGKTEKKIVISSAQQSVKLNIDTSNYKPEPRLNKHGKKYKKKPAIFKDEFY